MSFPLLQIQDLQVDFASDASVQTAVNGISLDVNRGEIHALVGESGSGKSVTALSVLQLLPARVTRYPKGKILFSRDGGQPVDLITQSKDSLRKIRGNEIAMIFQEPMSSLNPVFTCGEQVIEAIVAHEKLSQREAKQRTIELFRKVELPDPERIVYRYPHQLSGGQKQRVMIAMAMSCRPSLLICDEPTTALDVTVQKTILQLIRQLQQEEQMGVIFITHDLGVVSEIADKASVMYKGSIVEHGNTSQIFSSPVHPYTKALLACRPVNHPKGERLPIVSDFIGEGSDPKPASSRLQPVPRKTAAKEVLMEVKNLKVWFSGKKTFFGRILNYIKAVNDVSFVINKGETLGLVGESGCGKTTLGRTLLRLIEPTDGTIKYNGKHLTRYSEERFRKFRKDIQIVFQDPYGSLNPRLMVGDAIAEPLKVHGIIAQAKARKDKVVELLEKVHLKADHFNRYPHEFSGGQRQRIVIARALILQPSLIVFDESVSALDVSVQAQVLNLLTDLKKEYGFTSVFISHDLSVVRYVSDRILVMKQGKIVESGKSEEVYRDPKHEYTRKLLESIPGGVY